MVETGAAPGFVPLAGAAEAGYRSRGFTPAIRRPEIAGFGTLPFTGVDLGLVLVAGIGLVVMGYSLRRIARGADR